MSTPTLDLLPHRLATADLPKTGKILAADDDPQVLRVTRRALSALGYDVTTAPDGVAALAAVQAGAFDCIVSDISMPGMTGVELLKNIRRYDLDVPLILVTGEPSVETAVTAVRYGAFDYFQKPVGLAVLERTVGQAIQVHRLARLKREVQRLSGMPDSAADLAGLETRFDAALDQLWMAFQPIMSSSRRSVAAYEALVRTREPSIPHPGVLLDAAERLGRLPELGRRIRELVARRHTEVDGLLFVNLHPADLSDPDLYDPARPLSKIARKVVLEITERASLDGLADLRPRVQELRKLGFRIAIDDLGAGYAGLNSFVDLGPDIVKLDRSLVDDIDTNPTKQRLVAAMTKVCRELAIQVVAEGIETQGVRDALVQLECDMLQGFYFARPTEDIAGVDWK